MWLDAKLPKPTRILSWACAVLLKQSTMSKT